MAGYRHCTTESSAERQRQFETALLRLMGSKMLAEISIQDICGQVGLARKSFYRYFSSKEDCLCALVDHTLLDMTEIPVRGEHLQQMMERVFAHWVRHRDLLDALRRSDLRSLLMERALVCALEEYGIPGELRSDSGHEARIVFFVSGLIGVLLDWHAKGCQQSPAQLAAQLGGFLPQNPHRVF